jgi:hypothetical protein
MNPVPFARWLALAPLWFLLCGCSTQPPMTTSDPPAKLRLDRILEFYRRHQDDKKKPPQDEASFKEYIRGLPDDQKQGFGMTADVDELFTNPRDNKPYVVRYKVRIDPGKDTEAIAWESTPTGGARFVALTNGYVQEYDDEQFAEVKQK